MARLDDLWKKVEQLYEQKLDTRAAWADWIYQNHVVVVTNNAKRVAKQVGADPELSQVAALLHDIADYMMQRTDPKHEEESLKTARDVMKKSGFSDDEIALVVDDAIRYHSCYGNERPKSKEGLVLAAADAMAHFQTDFYIFATWAMGKQKTLEEVKAWALLKLERDFNNKIAFDDILEEVRPDYEMLKELFSR